MTIKIQAYQKQGIKTDEVIDTFEFCCWDSLSKWLNSGFVLYKCPKCEGTYARIEQDFDEEKKKKPKKKKEGEKK